MKKQTGAACFIYWGNNCIWDQMRFSSCFLRDLFQANAKLNVDLVFWLVFYLISQHESSKFTYLNKYYLQSITTLCLPVFFLLLPYSISWDTVMPAQHKSRGFGSRKQYFSSKRMTPLYVKQFPLVDIQCTVSQTKYLKYSSNLDICN